MPLSQPLADRHFIRRVRAVRRRPALAFCIGILVAILAGLLRWGLDPWIGETGVPFITFYPAIIVATFLGGVPAGLLTLLLGAVAGWYVFLPPAFGFVFNSSQIASVLVFLLLGGLNLVVVAVLNAALDRIVTHESNIRTLIEAAPNGIVVVDHHGVITLVNPRAEAMFGYPQPELLGQSIEILVPQSVRTGHVDLRKQYMRAPIKRPMGMGQRDFQAARKDGSAFPVEVDLAPIESPNGTRVMATVVDISERKQSEDRQHLLVGELRHRAQNILSVVQAIVHRTLSLCPPAEKTDLLGRLMALGRVNAMLADDNWESATVREIVTRELSVYSSRVRISGCDIGVSANVAQNFALLIHELATNAAKYGALSNNTGQVSVEGTIDRAGQSPDFVFAWTETNGPPVKTPERQGFGTTVLVDVAKQFGGDIQMTFAPEGLRYVLRADLSVIRAAQTSAA
jgi:PAS domain S-box-containing protein